MERAWDTNQPQTTIQNNVMSETAQSSHFDVGVSSQKKTHLQSSPDESGRRPTQEHV